MTKTQIHTLIDTGGFPEFTVGKKLVETHISWVILCDEFVYKIKRPIQYSFLDFSTLELRKHFCEREIEVNQRLAKDIYLAVLPIYEFAGAFTIGGNKGSIIDYAVKMRRLDSGKQMDILLSRHKVSDADIRSLAEAIAGFHKNTSIIADTDLMDLREKFNDLSAEKDFITENLGTRSGDIISQAVAVSNKFLSSKHELLRSRLGAGFFRDCHGDLHTRNIFLLPHPQPFDCIEFNDEFRQIDVLNEVAFLCMDLDAAGRTDLSDLFIDHYNLLFPAMRTADERKLFIYYKSYRANIRAKVNSLRARSATDEVDKTNALAVAKNYLDLMDSYIARLSK
jgi:hypothetical protein